MIKLGVIGFGHRISHFVNNTLRSLDPDIRVLGIVDSNQAAVQNRLAVCDKNDVRFFPDLKQMVSTIKPDGLIIGTLCSTHAPYAIEAAQYDIPLFLEKPVAVNFDQATALEKAYEKAKNQVVVSFPLRVAPLCTLAKKQIEAGAIGTPQHILGQSYISYGMVYFEEPLRDYESTQGLFVQKATHDFDYMSFLMGANIVRVCAMYTRGRVYGGTERPGLRCSECSKSETCLESPLNRKRNSSSDHDADHLCTFSIDCGTPETGMNEDSSSALLEFSSGVHGLYTQVFFSRRDASRRGATISGYNGTLSFDWDSKEMKYVSHHSPFTTVTREGQVMGTHCGGDVKLGQNFIDIIRAKEKSHTPIGLGIQSAYACLAAKTSAETGQFVKVRQIGQIA